MKNILSIVLIIAILFAGLFILTGCENNTGKAGSNDGGVNLKLNIIHHNKEVVFKTANVQKLLNSISLKYETIKNTEK